MGAEADAAEDLLETLYKWLSQDGSSSSNNNRPAAQGRARQDGEGASAGADQAQAHHVAYVNSDGQPAAGYGMHPAYMQAGYGAAGHIAAAPGAPNGFVFGGAAPREAVHHRDVRQDGASGYGNAHPSALPQPAGHQAGLSWAVDPQQQQAQPSGSAHAAVQQSEAMQEQQAYYYAYQAQMAETQAQMNAWAGNAYGAQNAGATSQAYYGGYYAPYPPGAPSAQMYGYPQYVAEAPVADSAAREEGLAYSKQPRYVEYTPYTMEDFKGKPYNSKQQKYWELGKIGPDLETDELREKREKAERMKQYAKDAHKKNMAVSTAKPNKAKGANSAATKPLSSRERALDFAKNIPKPEVKSKKVAGGEDEGPSAREEGEMTELDALEAQHRLDQQRIDEIRRELGNIGF
uniref:Uncharacterized protein n=1 Tax=Tetraselmis chuii TaxID=63592 RepID=A0A7S1SGZ8_9CHLO